MIRVNDSLFKNSALKKYNFTSHKISKKSNWKCEFYRIKFIYYHEI